MKNSKLKKVTEFRLKLYPVKLEEAREFYENTLSYPVIKEWDRGEKDKGVMFDLGQGIIEIQVTEKTPQPPAGVAVSLEVEDVMALWKEVGSKCDVVYEPRHNAWGDTSFCIKDPEGFEISFFTKDKE